MGYVIAAYAIVLGSLVAYGLWIALARRALARRPRSGAVGSGAGGSPPGREGSA